MGDDELNFTEEEARCWADDPHNQEQDWSEALRIFALSAFLVLVVLTLLWVVSTAVLPQGPAGALRPGLP